MREKLKNYNIPMLVLSLLIMTGCFGYVIYNRNNIFGDIDAQNNVVSVDHVENKKEEVVESKEPDHTLINGYWKSETTEEGRFLEFTIDYPEVTNFDGAKGTVRYDPESKRYIVTIKHETGDSVVYLGDINNNNCTIYYYENSEKDEKTLSANRDPDSVPENVIDKPAEQKPETGTSNSGNNKPSANTGNNKPSGNSSGNSNNPKGHYEERQVCVQEAYDEQVLVKKGECTNVLVKEAYDSQEMVYLEGAYYGADRQEIMACNQCGAEFWNGGAADHIANSEGCGGYHNEFRDISEPYWHNVDYRTVHHDAVYETRCEPDEYKTVHHDAVYETQMVWVED